MADVIYKVFVSSTYEDLREERSELQKALLKLKCLPIGMELFPSADDETWDFIAKQIDDSDYYMVIVAGRYGSEAPDGLSFTEKEYDYARQIGKRVIAFLHVNPSNIAASKIDLDERKRKKLTKFIEKIRKSPVNFFAGPHDLAANATLSFVALRDSHPATGFIRADQTVDYKKYAELLEENRQLKEQLAAISAERADEFRGAHEPISVMVSVYQEGSWEKISVEDTLVNVFLTVADSIIVGNTDEYFINSKLTDINFGPKISGDDRKYIEIEPVRKKFFGLRLIELELRPDGHGGQDRHWMLTEYGKQQYGLLMDR
jgi:hypothetical protein